MSQKEVKGVQPVCKTCGWTGPIYRIDVEGSLEFARLSAIIESRLNHGGETKHADIECRPVYEEVSKLTKKAFRQE